MSFDDYCDQCDLANYDPVAPICIECDVVMIMVDSGEGIQGDGQPSGYTVWECPVCHEQDSEI